MAEGRTGDIGQDRPPGIPDPAALLMAWLSPAYPVGAFAYSHGLEQAISEGAVDGPDSLGAWVGDALAHGAGRTDAILAAHALRAAAASDSAAVAGLAELALALAPSAERAMETALQGAAFAATTREGWGIAVADAPYPVAVGAAAGQAGVPVAALLPLLLQGFAANLISAGVRLIPIGQTDGQRVLAGLMPAVAQLAAEAGAAPLEAIGSAAFALDIASQRHETLGTRIFRS